nr:MAG TPA: hypothetical protein [Caudoviricetes sp.]
MLEREGGITQTLSPALGRMQDKARYLWGNGLISLRRAWREVSNFPKGGIAHLSYINATKVL